MYIYYDSDNDSQITSIIWGKIKLGNSLDHSQKYCEKIIISIINLQRQKKIASVFPFQNWKDPSKIPLSQKLKIP